MLTILTNSLYVNSGEENYSLYYWVLIHSLIYLILTKNKKIAVKNHCFGCTAGAGSSCSGALVNWIFTTENSYKSNPKLLSKIFTWTDSLPRLFSLSFSIENIFQFAVSYFILRSIFYTIKSFLSPLWSHRTLYVNFMYTCFIQIYTTIIWCECQFYKSNVDTQINWIDSECQPKEKAHGNQLTDLNELALAGTLLTFDSASMPLLLNALLEIVRVPVFFTIISGLDLLGFVDCCFVIPTALHTYTHSYERFRAFMRK
jgi:hypothetical protein